MAGGAQVLVTFNVRDFPAASVDPHDIEVVNPDAFLLDQLDLYPARVGRAPDRSVAPSQPPTSDHGSTVGQADPGRGT